MYMVKCIWVLLASIFTMTLSYGQDTYENKYVGIKIVKPQTWILATNEDLQSSFDKIKFTDEELQKVLSSNKGTITLVTYYKYNINSVNGLIPTIKVTIRSNPTSNMSDFKQVMVASTNRVKTVVKDFEFIDNFKEVDISNYPGLFYSCRYSFTLANSDTMKVRTRYYMIPKGIYFISISLMDNETSENCSEVFDQFLANLQLTK